MGQSFIFRLLGLSAVSFLPDKFFPMNAPAHPILNNSPNAMLTRRHLVTLMGAGGLSFAMAGCSMLTPEYSAYVRGTG